MATHERAQPLYASRRGYKGSETPEDTLRRKFADELGLTASFLAEEVCKVDYSSPQGEVFQWRVFHVQFQGAVVIVPPDGIEALYMKPARFRRSRTYTEQRILQCSNMTGL